MDQYLYIATFAAVAVSILWCMKRSVAKGPPLPPGPRGLPIVGYLPFLGKNLLHQFTHMAREHGPIYKFWLGHKLCVVISSPSLVRQVVRDQDPTFANRDSTIASRVLSYGGNDIAFSAYTPKWRALRKLLVRELQSNTSLEASYALRRDACRKTVGYVYDKAGQPLNIAELAFASEFNVVTNLLWGGAIVGAKGEKLGAELRDMIEELDYLVGKPNLSDLFPVLAGLDLQGIKKKSVKVVEYIDRILEEIMVEHEKFSSGAIKSDGRKDFLQIFYELRDKQESSTSNISRMQLKALLMDIIIAGTDTAAIALELAMAELMNNPEAMKKAKDELSDVVGLDKLVEESHMPKLPYMAAVMKETLRLHPPVPFLVPRCPSETSFVGGYRIPKDTRVLLNVWAIQRDPSLWDRPMEFRPERFLNGAGKWDFSGNSSDYLPFGSGRRMCPGMPLGERMVTHQLASLVHCFEWKLPEGEALDMAVKFGVVLRKDIPLLAIPTPTFSHQTLYV